jgi:hypothetical protein
MWAMKYDQKHCLGNKLFLSSERIQGVEIIVLDNMILRDRISLIENR